MVSSVEVRNTYTTHCFPGARVLDLLEVMPTIKKQIPALKTVVLFIRSNDIMRVKSVKLRDNFLQLTGECSEICRSVLAVFGLDQWLMCLTW